MWQYVFHKNLLQAIYYIIWSVNWINLPKKNLRRRGEKAIIYWLGAVGWINGFYCWFITWYEINVIMGSVIGGYDVTRYCCLTMVSASSSPQMSAAVTWLTWLGDSIEPIISEPWWVYFTFNIVTSSQNALYRNVQSVSL